MERCRFLRRCKLPQGRDVIQHPEGAALGRQHQVIAAHHEIRYRNHWQIRL